MTARLFGAVPLQVAHQEGAGPNEGHLPDEHVPEFRELVQARGTEKLPKRREPSTVGQQVALPILLAGHGSELDDPELAPPDAWARLHEHRRPSVLVRHDSREYREAWSEYHESGPCGDNVDGSLGAQSEGRMPKVF